MADGAPHRDVGLGEALKLFLANYSNFRSRSSRGAYWWAFLVLALIGTGAATIDIGLLGADRSGVYVLSTLFSLTALVPAVSAGVRRLHDMGRSGWWLLFAVAPFGAVIPLILCTVPGMRSENRFGPDVEAGRSAEPLT